MTPDLWPPISLIRSTFGREGGDARAGGMVAAGPHEDTAATHPSDGALLLLAPSEIARRRQAVAARAFDGRWAPGRLISVVHEGRLLGVLLDEWLSGSLWRGWMAACESQWAGAHDVLLEPGDEPFEPMFGLIQAWNMLALEQVPQLCAHVLGELSAVRLAAIRAVHEEWVAGEALPIAPEPGRIAPRSVAGGEFRVLSGTPLDEGDPRIEYQDLYRGAAARFVPPPVTEPMALQPEQAEQTGKAPAVGGWARARRWFAADPVVRWALVLMAVMLAAQNAAWWRGPETQVGEVVDAPPHGLSAQADARPAPAPPADLVVQWKEGVEIEEVGDLLRLAGAEVVGGPDALGRWRLRSADLARTRQLLAASALVDTIVDSVP